MKPVEVTHTGVGATTVADVVGARTLLFVPGDRPDRYAKAASAGADVMIIDLEDAVRPEAKDSARESAAQWFADGNPGIVRINAAGTEWHQADLDALADVVDVVFLPKAESPDAVTDVGARLRPGGGVLALVETARGVLTAPQIAALPGVCRLAFGNFDLSTELGIDRDDHLALAPMRTGLVVASAAAQLPPPIDGVSGAIDDADAIEADASHAARLGFGGKLCIHPRQLQSAGGPFVPSEESVAWARRVLEVVAESGSGAAVLDNEMIDRPVVDRARRILDAAGVRDETP